MTPKLNLAAIFITCRATSICQGLLVLLGRPSTSSALNLHSRLTSRAILYKDRTIFAASVATRFGEKSSPRRPVTSSFISFMAILGREIAELARLPIAAIYNELKIARTEVSSHLRSPLSSAL
jgi:hypothetical protein